VKETLKRYWPYIKGYKKHYLIVLFGIILTVIATAGTAQIMQPLMDDMFIAKKEKMLYLIPLLLIGIYILKSLGRYLQSVYTNYIGLHIISRLREDLLEKIMGLDMAFLYAHRSGELISRITNDLARVQYFVSSMLPEFIREGATVIALVGYVIYLNPTLAFWSLFVVPLTVYPLILIAKRLKKLSHRSQEKNADVLTRLTEVFNNNEIIKANATEEYELHRFKEQNEHFFKINMKATYINELVSPVMEIIAAAGLAAVIFVGGKQVYSGAMSVGEFTAFLTAAGLVFQPVRRIGSIYGKIQDAQAASERVFHIFDLQNEIQDGVVTLNESIKSINFHDVSLNLGEKCVLQNITVNVNAGDSIALVGQSGGGKSSFINLILRFYDPLRGSITLNGEPLNHYTQNSLRQQISMVSQRVYIFQDSLAANVAYGSYLDEERVTQALQMADALDFARALPNGIHTIMQEFGSNLSGGQRQRIAIARALYKNASLLIFDEATSALDNKSEKKIQENLKQFSNNKITITIAHRLSTIEHADMILYFEEGSIVARGTHQELLKTCENYQRLAGKLEV
jgi:ATP-binding cassette, subfamily B, bacterial MsbA